MSLAKSSAAAAASAVRSLMSKRVVQLYRKMAREAGPVRVMYQVRRLRVHALRSACGGWGTEGRWRAGREGKEGEGGESAASMS